MIQGVCGDREKAVLPKQSRRAGGGRKRDIATKMRRKGKKGCGFEKGTNESKQFVHGFSGVLRVVISSFGSHGIPLMVFSQTSLDDWRAGRRLLGMDAM
jgi:hypothetical protein